MQRTQQVKSKVGRIGRVSGALVLVLVCAQSAIAAEESSADTKPTLQLAPIRLGISKHGKVDYLLRYDESERNSNLLQILGLTVGAGVRAESFIWQPWLAQVGTQVGAEISTSTTDSSAGSLAMDRTNRMLSRTITGGADLRLLPRSRFPFSAKVVRSDNRSEIGLSKVQQAMLKDSFDLMQSYRPIYGATRMNASYSSTRSEDADAYVSHDRQLSMGLAMLPFTAQTLNIESLRLENDSSRTDSVYMNRVLTARHTYRPVSAFSLATLASLTGTSNSLSGIKAGQETLQFSSAGTWRPTDRLTMTGGVRLFEVGSYSNGVDYPVNGYTGANLGANYAVNRWFRLYGSATVNDTNGVQTVSSTSFSNLSAAVQHRPETIKIGSYNYTRYIAANISNNTYTATDTLTNTNSSETYQSYSTRLQHGLDRSIALRSGSLNSSITQALISTGRSRSSPASTLQHSGAVGWYRGGGRLSLRADDNREMGGAKSFYQFVNLQGSQFERLKGNATLTGDLTVSLSRQGYDTGSIPVTDSMTSTASLDYVSLRAFNVRRLTFRSTLRVISADLLKSNDMNQNTQNQGRYAWNNELIYKVGKLDVELKGLLEEVQASQHISVMFHVRRNF